MRENFSTCASCGFGGAALVRRRAPGAGAAIVPPRPRQPARWLACAGGASAVPAASGPRRIAAAGNLRRSGRRDPDRSLRVDGDAARRHRPLVLVAGPAPVADEVPAASNSSTGGAGTQHSSEVFGVVAAPISVRAVIES